MKKQIWAALLLGGSMIFPVGAQNKAAEPAEHLFHEGKEMFVQRNYIGALDRFRRYEQQGGRQYAIEADYYTAVARYMAGVDPSFVASATGAFLERFPESLDRSRVMLAFGRLLVEQEDYRRAGSIFPEIDDLTLDDEDLAAYLLYYAYLRMQDGQSDALTEQLLIGAAKNKGDMGSQALIFLCSMQIEDGRLGDAERTLAALHERPKFADDVTAYTAEIHLLRGENREAADIADRLMARSAAMRNRAQLLRVAGNAYYRLGDAQKTMDYLSSYSNQVGDRIAPADAYALGVTYFKQGMMAESMRPLAAATADKGELGAEAALYLGQARLSEGLHSEALVAFEMAATQQVSKPVREVGMYNMAMLMRSTGQSSFGQAVRVAEGFLNEFPRSSYREQMASILTESYYTGKDYASSLRSIEKISRPTESILAAKQFVLSRMAAEREAAGYDAEALSLATKSIALGNKGDYYGEALFLRGGLHYRADAFDASATDYRAYLATAGSDRDAANLPLAYYRLGYSLFNAERYDGALDAFREYVSRNNGAPELMADAHARIGDCRYMKRDFAGARESYSAAYRAYPSGGDYVLLRRARLEGLAKQYNEQIATLDKLIQDFPHSRHLTTALYEKGRGAVLSDKNAVAEQAFNAVIKKSPESREARQSSLQLGLLYYNTGRTQDAIRTYKRIIDRYPRSEETAVALADLRSIYLEEDRIDEYSAYVGGLDGKVTVAPSETEQLTFLAAERKYRRRQADARRDLENYLSRYPQGSDRHKAELYLADLDYQAGNPEAAYARYTSLVGNAGLPEDYKIDARLRLGRMQHEKGEYKAAMRTYQSVLDTDGAEAVRDQAVGGLAEAAYASKDYRAALAALDGLPKDDMPRPLRLVRAKSHQALKQNAEALKEYTALAQDFSTIEGAEAVVMQAQMEMEAKRLAGAKAILEKFIAKSTPHQYWLARGFILLSDVYRKEGDTFTARQYLESLLNNYPNHDDDIHEMIADRL
ncbi:tetratricopeptide repeat protein [Porphyromonas loveana]|uniref:tetratricopeptide repeat protein n=1 Tax=Porphyromonas loveana TaxID=1884669 RepID=UPI0035A10FE2